MDVLVFKMDPRNQSGFTLSFQIVEEELIRKNLQDNKGDLDMLASLGGVQPIPNQEGQFLSRHDQQQKVQDMSQKNRDLDLMRRRKMEERKRLIELEKRKEEEQYQRQSEFL